MSAVATTGVLLVGPFELLIYVIGGLAVAVVIVSVIRMIRK
jgi:hypothetical protein